MMQQYLEVKEKCQDSILFFRLGDFYEMFFEDAVTASRELELVLTGRDCGLEERAPMCGVPFHAANSYITKLIGKGYKVAICEQLEDPSLAKGIVKRDIIKIITPGTYTDSNFLEESKNNYVMSIYIDSDRDEMGICFADISTGDFYCTDGKFEMAALMDEISKYYPKEVLVQNPIKEDLIKTIKEKFGILCTVKEDSFFTENSFYNLEAKFEGFNKNDYTSSLIFASNGLLNYIMETQKINLCNINNMQYYNITDYLSIDVNSRRNLEITENLRDKGKKNSLLWVLDKTSTAMGSRQLRKWIEQPLISKNKIEFRLNAVEELCKNILLQTDLKEALNKIYDIERIVGKIATKSINAKELISLKNSIQRIPEIKNILLNFNSPMLIEIYNNLDELRDVHSLLESSLSDNPPISLKEGNIIKDGYNSDIDELRNIKLNGKQWISSLESKERDITGIKSLKIGYNKVFGYFLEITNANKNMVPEGRYIRKQTLSNCERYITPELKEMEDKILGAEERLINLEYEIFLIIRERIESETHRLKNTARLIAELDCLNSLAVVALENNYYKPSITEDGKIIIEEGRHPVVEKMLPTGTFVANDCNIDNCDETLMLITGPNMAGKSTYMRQVALITLMAQIGSFVPAKKAEISICDKIFTRIGASDDLSAGKSTFMVEMAEVSNILKNATNKSLVLLDEVGRGTSTYDGLSIAWAVIEYICTNPNIRCKTLFATHYHELTKLENLLNGVKNYSVAVKEIGSEIAFLRKIVRGGADQSYGIEVAKLAGLPEAVIRRSKELLAEFEKVKSISQDDRYKIEETSGKLEEAAVTQENKFMQINFNDIEKENLIKDIKSIDVLNLTPMEGFNKLYELVRKAKAL